jgi:hypothetical protein
MPRTCTVCAHPERADIDKALLAGEPYRNIAAQKNLSPSALVRHKAEHLPAQLAQAKQAAEVAQADDLFGEMRRLQKITLALLGRAVNDGDNRTALMAVREARGNLEMLGRLLGELEGQSTTVNIAVLPDWLAVRGRLFRALEPYPDARLAAAHALGDGNGVH